MEKIALRIAHRYMVVTSSVKPLYGHKDMNSAYMVDDYPYGRQLRCRIRYWLEFGGKKGYRFVSQTENPKTLRWNKPKKSTYTLLGANMFLDSRGYVQWEGISEYSDDGAVLEFLKKYPRTDTTNLKVFAPKKVAYLQRAAEGQVIWKINGVPQQPREEDMGRAREELAVWQEIIKHLH